MKQLCNHLNFKSRKVIKKIAICLLFLLVFLSVPATEIFDRLKIASIEIAKDLRGTEARAGSGDVILLWDTANGSVPGGWTCISCSGGQAFYGALPRASSSYSSNTYGADTHDHTLTYSSATPGADDDTTHGNAGSAVAINTHTHTWGAPTVNNGDVRPPFKNLNFIYANNPSTLPANIIAVFDTGSLPSGWTRYSALDGNYLRGYSDNATGGSANHTHTTGAVTSGASGAQVADSGAGNSAASGHTHTLSASSLSTADNNAPPYLEVVFAYNSSGGDTAVPSGLIAFFDASPPADWDTVSDASPWNGSFLKGAASYGGSGGSAADHDHGASNDFASGNPSTTNNNRGATGANTGAHNTHTHTVTYTIDSKSSLPVYRDVIAAKYTPPTGPDLSDYTVSESALDYSNCGTTGCGGRLAQTITLSGSNFGASVSNKDTCTAGASNGCVRVANYTIPAASISTWNATQIIFTVPAGISVFGGSGATCGSAGSGVCVTQNAVSDAALEFWVFPNITSVSPSGAGEGKEGDSITISGSRFDTNAATGTVVFQNCGTGDVSATINSWSDTSVGVTVPTGIADDDDACDIKLTRAAGTGSKTASSTNFMVLPEIDSIAAIASDKARNYDIGDTDGLVMLVGTHFGGAGSVTILGTSASQHATAEGQCSVGGWSATSTCREVPNDADYTGDVILTRTSDSKTHTYSGFRILPRITGFDPTSGAFGDSVTVQGNHFCQNGGSCPGGFDESNKVMFQTNATSTYFGSWIGTAIGTQVPSDADTGSNNVVVTSNALYSSNAKSFTVVSSTPDDPTNLDQFKDAGLTQAIAVGATASATPIYLKMTMNVSVSGGTLYPQIEATTTSASFACSGGGACAFATEGTGQTAPYPATGTVAISPVPSLPSGEVYHWQARVRHNKGGSNYYSAWVSFGGNPENATDFKIDTAAPTITFPGGDTCGTAVDNLDTNSARISWSFTPGSDSADGEVEYSTSTDFSNNLFYPTPAEAIDFSHAITLNNLDSYTYYYFRARSRDDAGNLATRPTSPSYCSFQTNAVGNKPAKTTKFFIAGATSTVTNGNPGNYTFSVFMPESGTTTKSAFVVVAGIYDTSGGSPGVTVQLNSETSKTYVLPAAAAKSHFKIVHPATSVNVDPGTNSLSLTPDANTTLYISSADIYVTYSYSP